MLRRVQNQIAGGNVVPYRSATNKGSGRRPRGFENGPHGSACQGDKNQATIYIAQRNSTTSRCIGLWGRGRNLQVPKKPCSEEGGTPTLFQLNTDGGKKKNAVCVCNQTSDGTSLFQKKFPQLQLDPSGRRRREVLTTARLRKFKKNNPILAAFHDLYLTPGTGKDVGWLGQKRENFKNGSGLQMAGGLLCGRTKPRGYVIGTAGGQMRSPGAVEPNESSASSDGAGFEENGDGSTDK